MARLIELEARVANMTGLLEVIGAMRSLAGMRLQEAELALPSARRYAQTISAAIAAVLRRLREVPAEPGHRRAQRAIVLYAAEHGFVGAFTERLLTSAQSKAAPGEALFVLGSRAAAIAAEHGLHPAWTAPMPARAANIPATVRRLTEELYRRIARAEISRVDLIYAAHAGFGPATLQHRTLIPLDPAAVPPGAQEQSPLSNLPPAALFEQLTAEYVFALLAEAALDSLASENSARFAAMSAARENVSGKLDALRATAREIRQSEITTELLDVVTGARALEERESSRTQRPPRSRAHRLPQRTPSTRR